MSQPSKKILVVNRKSPYGSLRSREAIDTLLVASAYGVDVSALYLDDGVFQLVKSQHPEQIQSKNIAKMVSAFEMYDLKNIYVDEQSIAYRGLQAQDFVTPVKVLNTDQIKSLLHQQDQILSF
ncbi:MAG: sulfurtransferase complex subunit TusC [Gammaproteobacteria bacterium]|nr:MAG: sulfurtransferase complex subunit TusC [Gammaproteobacteria bacterium]